MGAARAVTGTRSTERDRVRRTCTAVVVLALVLSACGGGDGDSGATQGSIQGDTVVIDPEQLEAMQEEADDGAAEVVTVDQDQAEEALDEAATSEADTADEDEIEVAEAEEDPIDGLLNSLTVFNTCLTDEGFELDGFPGDDTGRTLADFDQAYLQALGACAAESGIQDAATSFADAQANLTPEQIEQTNFGLPVFKACLEDRGWEVGDLVPDERGALGFGGDDGIGLTPPGGGGLADFNADDINACRLEAEQYTEENFEGGGDADGG